MLFVWFVLSIVLIAKTSSNTVGENGCGLSPKCTNDSLSLSIKQSTVLRCTNRISCFTSDENSQYAVNHIDKIYIHLKNVRIKKKMDGYQFQAVLSSYDDDFFKQGNQSLLVKFSFGKDHTCYTFFIPSSDLVSSKNILLSCFRIPVLQQDHLDISFQVHKKNDEVISVQAINYTFSNAAVGQWLGGSLFRITYDFDDEFIYFSINATQDLKCSFNYSISVYKSFIPPQNQSPCSIKQYPVYRWSDTLNSPYHRLNMSQNFLSLSQKYCIYAVFSKNQYCGTLYSKDFFYISFFQLPPSGADKFFTNVPGHFTVLPTVPTYLPTSTYLPTVHFTFCKKWNFTIDIKTNKPAEKGGAEGAKSLGTGQRKDLIAAMTLWKQYPSCFSSYCMYLYKFDLPSCDIDYKNKIKTKFQYEARPNGTVIFNSPICEGKGHLLLLGKLESEARPNKTEVVFKNVTIGYYCIVVVPFSVDGHAMYNWARDSRAIIVTETSVSTITEFNKKDENTAFGTKVIVAMSFLLFFTAFALWSCSVYIRRSKVKTNKVFSDEKGKENKPLLTLPVDKVYLFHSHDDYSIKNDVSQLKNFLKDDAPFSVITLSDILPEILEQPSGTVSNLLECECSGKGPSCASNKRFIIVISEKVLRNMMLTTSRYDNYSILISLEDRAFYMVLDFITANWREAYCHLFLVAFNESIFEDRRFESMALKNVGAHYTIPDRLERLCVKLGLSYPRHLRVEGSPMCPESQDVGSVASN